jgi:hypothetical protein
VARNFGSDNCGEKDVLSQLQDRSASSDGYAIGIVQGGEAMPGDLFLVERVPNRGSLLG